MRGLLFAGTVGAVGLGIALGVGYAVLSRRSQVLADALAEAFDMNEDQWNFR